MTNKTDKIINIVEEVLKNAELTKVFLKFEKLNEMYTFLRQFGDFKKEELQIFLNELNQELRLCMAALNDNKLELILGGKNTVTSSTKRLIGAGLVLLSLTNPIINTGTFATTSRSIQESTTINQKRGVKEIAKKITAYLLNNGVKVAGGAAIAAGLIYVGYRYVSDIKYPIIIDFESKGNEANVSEKSKEIIARLQNERREYIFVFKINNKYKVRHFIPSENEIIEFIINKSDMENILNIAFKDQVVKTGVYVGNKGVFEKLLSAKYETQKNIKLLNINENENCDNLLEYKTELSELFKKCYAAPENFFDFWYEFGTRNRSKFVDLSVEIDEFRSRNKDYLKERSLKILYENDERRNDLYSNGFYDFETKKLDCYIHHVAHFNIKRAMYWMYAICIEEVRQYEEQHLRNLKLGANDVELAKEIENLLILARDLE